ncbi:alpha/beta hydrolase [Gordonia sp. CPCC 205515]|uniref:alpha/beta fold hydrolase n=1 Tax=Gordonia sp. CPCC 205515 TaxID=3140791 RepID=UPI003AF3C410
MSDVIEAAPKWFLEALAVPVDTGRVDVNGASIAYRAWGEPNRPGIVLVHGGMAHSRWWDHIAPQLTDGRRVVALDLSGHGDSEWRNEYSPDDWVAEVLAVAEHGGITGRPVLVGHSMGGIVAFHASATRGELVDRVMIFDSPIRDLTPEELEMRVQRPESAPKVYPTIDAAVARFRLVPEQDTTEPYVFDHIARSSLKSVEGGWSWKFDGNRIGRSHRTTFDQATAQNPIAYFRSENGIISDELLDQMRVMFGPDALVVELPVAGHHPVFDQPLAVVTAIRTTLAAWG